MIADLASNEAIAPPLSIVDEFSTTEPWPLSFDFDKVWQALLMAIEIVLNLCQTQHVCMYGMKCRCQREKAL